MSSSFAVPDASVVSRLVRILLERGLTIAAAESLTAGKFMATLADVPGTSGTLRGGFVAYATDLKAELVDVPEDVLATDGPVAESTAMYLALGAQQRCSADIGVGLTGVAGPTEQDGHPVGEVWLGFALPGQEPVAERHQFAGSRAQIRKQAVAAAVSSLVARLGNKSGSSDVGQSNGK
ncbi:CinA family protein [Corynebacterium ulceribovis]|uniref:CinA family protein n=1 Tax=Corynebacterium ulceribovis TaxID=487732 RepID=UPI000375BC9A|nr:nicotinamide-nucleotide amidohydrolase family protein [Corynebacterium ulceribovis]